MLIARGDLDSARSDFETGHNSETGRDSEGFVDVDARETLAQLQQSCWNIHLA